MAHTTPERWGQLLAQSAQWGCITQVAGIEAGHATHAQRPTGCTVLIAREGAVAGVDVRGAAPGTRETDLLQPANLVDKVHAIALCGGSAWGLDAAGGVMQWLDEQGVGLQVGSARVPIVPAAVLFDLLVGDSAIRPSLAHGLQACRNAGRGALACGSVGAGSGATVGKLFGMEYAMRGGVGSASVRVNGATVGAVIACNALGDVIDPDTGLPLAGARAADGRALLNAHQALLDGRAPLQIVAGSNTTIGVVATDASLSKAQAQRLATAAHDGLARCISPVHTMSDGDTIFAMSTGQCHGRQQAMPDMLTLSAMAVEAVMRATLRAVLCASTYRSLDGQQTVVAGTDFWRV